MATPALVEIFEYNAFTDKPFAGNPAGVVIDAAGLDTHTMQRIASQMNLAETAFLLPSSDPEADVRLRWFTPALEVDLCGHATIAAFTAAAERGLFPVSEVYPKACQGPEIHQQQDERQRNQHGFGHQPAKQAQKDREIA